MFRKILDFDKSVISSSSKGLSVYHTARSMDSVVSVDGPFPSLACRVSDSLSAALRTTRLVHLVSSMIRTRYEKAVTL
jgi:hypothetical protein